MATVVRRAQITSVRGVRPGSAGARRSVELEALAREAGVHPDLVRRLIALGLLAPVGGTASAPLFPRDAGARLARAARLRRDLGLSYAGAILACDLLARIDNLEERLRRYESTTNRSR